MCGRIKTLKHNVRITLQVAYHGCKNLTHTSKTRHAKRTQMVVTGIGSRFARLLLFQTGKNRTQLNCRVKRWGLKTRTVAGKSWTGDLNLRMGLDILKIW